MADKQLTDKAWKAFAAKKSYKDANFIKALAKFDKAGDDGQAQLDALDDVLDQAAQLAKANKADKELAAYLKDVEVAAAKARKLAEVAAKKTGAEAAEEEPLAAAMSSQVKTALKAVRSGATAQVLIASAGHEVAVLVSPRSISAGRKKLLVEQLQGAGSVKFLHGECIFSDKAFTFALDATVASLAKRLKLAVLNQTGMKIPVRILAGGIEELEAELEDAEGAASAAEPDGPASGMQAADAPQAPGAQDSPNAGQAPDVAGVAGSADEQSASVAAAGPDSEVVGDAADDGAATDPRQAEFASRMADLRSRADSALAAGNPVAKKAQTLFAFAQGKVDAGALEVGHQTLDAAEKLLAGITASSQTAAAAAGDTAAPQQPGTAQPPAPAALATIATARQAWVATRQKIDSDIGSLHTAFSSAFAGHPAGGDLTKAFRARVDSVLGTLDEALAHKLEAVNKAADPAERAKLVAEAHGLISNYSRHVASDPTIAELDRNPFVPLTLQKTITATLASLAKAIR